jgi:tetratricopeptide (TPR) repeat protein
LANIKDIPPIEVMIFSLISSFILFRVISNPSQRLFDEAKEYNESCASMIYTRGERGDPDKIEIYRKKRRVLEIEKRYKKAIELEDRDGKRLNVAIGYLQLGFYYRMFEYWDKAEDSLYTSLRILKDLNYETPADESILSDLAVALSRVGELKHVKGEYREAIKKYEESLEIYQKLGNEEGVRTVDELMKQIKKGRNNVSC